MDRTPKTTMKFLAVLFIVVALSGCYQTVNQFDMKRAAKACGSVEEIVDIGSHAVGAETVQCFDGKKYSLNAVDMTQ